MIHDPFSEYKAAQRESWALFAPLEVFTIQSAGELAEHANVSVGQRVLDVGCGTGVVAIAAARRGARVQGLDLSPVLLERAKWNAGVAKVEIDFSEGDVENLPFGDCEFDCVVSQFGHMFAPRPDVALGEMLRVLKPGGTIAFATWPGELFTGRMFSLVAKYAPPPPDVPSPTLWGEPSIIRERLGDRVRDLLFDCPLMLTPVLSVEHVLLNFENTAGPVVKLKQKLERENPEQLQRFRDEFRELISSFARLSSLKQHYLMTRATKV
ncbi:MAG: class I SAM-dependent methyltransferase [Bdellovibrionota bacterium]